MGVIRFLVASSSRGPKEKTPKGRVGEASFVSALVSRVIRSFPAVGAVVFFGWLVYLAGARISAVPSYQRILSQPIEVTNASASENRQNPSADGAFLRNNDDDDPATSADGRSATAGSEVAAVNAALPAGISYNGPAQRKNGEYQKISFELLGSFVYDMPDSEGFSRGMYKDQIPAKIKALNDQKVAIEGFMLATMGYKDKVRNFILLANQMGCCFGVPPPMNGWIYVTMKHGKLTTRVCRPALRGGWI